MLKYFSTFTLCLSFFAAPAQMPRYVYEAPDEQIPIANLHKWVTATAGGYSGVYHFGESESEWDMLVIADDSAIVFQAFTNKWTNTDKSKNKTWVHDSRTFRDVSINGNTFVTDSVKGYFMVYKDGTAERNGIVLLDRSGNPDTAEFGGWRESADKYWPFFWGDYPELSRHVLGNSYFDGKTKEQLQVMRNEIFARYGLRFVKGGKMYNWFIKKDWYVPWRDEVDSCLTPIENKNLSMILYYEKRQ